MRRIGFVFCYFFDRTKHKYANATVLCPVYYYYDYNTFYLILVKYIYNHILNLLVGHLVFGSAPTFLYSPYLGLDLKCIVYTNTIYDFCVCALKGFTIKCP